VVLGERGRRGRIENGFVTHDKGELLSYFTERHAKGERLSLLKVNSTQAGLLDEETNVGLIYVLTRDAEDLNPALGGLGRVAFGKGGINGESRQLFAWSMEMRAGVKNPEGGRRLALRRPPGWRPGEAVVACARVLDLQASGFSVRYGMGDRSSDEESLSRSVLCLKAVVNETDPPL